MDQDRAPHDWSLPSRGLELEKYPSNLFSIILDPEFYRKVHLIRKKNSKKHIRWFGDGAYSKKKEQKFWFGEGW